MAGTDKINLPDGIPGGTEHPKDGKSPVRVYGPAEPVAVVYGPASMPKELIRDAVQKAVDSVQPASISEESKKSNRKGLFGALKEKISPSEPVAVYGPAEWFEPHKSEPEPLDVYGPAEWFDSSAGTEPTGVYGPAAPIAGGMPVPTLEESEAEGIEPEEMSDTLCGESSENDSGA